MFIQLNNCAAKALKNEGKAEPFYGILYKAHFYTEHWWWNYKSSSKIDGKQPNYF